jgi:hypothetical protein
MKREQTENDITRRAHREFIEITKIVRSQKTLDIHHHGTTQASRSEPDHQEN